MSQVAHQAEAHPGFRGMKRLTRNISTPPLDGMLVHNKVSPQSSSNFAHTHLFTWVERCTLKVKYLAQQHDTMSTARDRTRSARSGVERSKREDTAPIKN